MKRKTNINKRIEQLKGGPKDREIFALKREIEKLSKMLNDANRENSKLWSDVQYYKDRSTESVDEDKNTEKPDLTQYDNVVPFRKVG